MKLFSISVDANEWQLDWYQLNKLSQDECIVRLGHGTIVRGLVVSHGDPQSDAGIVRRPKQTDDAFAFRSLCDAVREALTKAWDIDEFGALLEIPSINIALPAFEHCEVDISAAPIRDSELLANQLLELDADHAWDRLRKLIILAEDMAFSESQTARLGPRLIGLAQSHRGSAEPEDVPVVLSALRTGASMLSVNDAFILVPLLEPGYRIETSAVALKMIGRLFEAQPPMKVDQNANLALEVHGIIDSLLNLHAISSREIAAKAQLAIYALAALASSGIVDVVRQVRGLNVSWFIKQTARDLEELLREWNNRSGLAKTDPIDLVEQAMEVLVAT